MGNTSLQTGTLSNNEQSQNGQETRDEKIAALTPNILSNDWQPLFVSFWRYLNLLNLTDWAFASSF
jgi:hypothetical protein